MRSLFTLLPVIFFLGACTAEKAHVDGNPPRVDGNTAFKAGGLQGEFTLLKDATLFLWPVENAEGEPITREQDIEIRTNVIVANATLGVLYQKIEELQVQIGTLTKQFVSAECGLFEDTFPLDPDPNSPTVDDWIEPDPNIPGQAEAIAACQKNQAAREQIIAEGVSPLEKKAGEVSLGLLNTLGEENLFVGFSQLNISFSDKLTIQAVGFQKEGLVFDSESEDPYLQVRDIRFDPTNGLLAFSLPGYDFPDDRMIYVGDYRFELEITQNGGRVSLGGNFIFEDHFNDRTRLGRAAFSGQLQNPAAE